MKCNVVRPIRFSGSFWELIYFLKQATKGRDRAGETPMEILKKRYAKGKITKEEFDSMKKDISE